MDTEFLIMSLQFSLVGTAALALLFYATVLFSLTLWAAVEVCKLALDAWKRHLSNQLDGTATALQQTLKTNASKRRSTVQ